MTPDCSGAGRRRDSSSGSTADHLSKRQEHTRRMKRVIEQSSARLERSAKALRDSDVRLLQMDALERRSITLREPATRLPLIR